LGRHRYKRNAKYDEPFTRRRWNAQSRTCRHTKLATLLTKSELIKAGGSALVKLLLKLVNWVWELETLPTAWSQGVNLFKAGDTQLPGNYRITLVSICRMFTNMLRKRMESQVHLHGSGGVQKQRSCTDNLFVLTHLLRGWQANKTVYAFFLDVRKAYDTVWRDGLSAKLLEVWMEVMAGPARPSC
jgi:hypothetical protein